MEEGRRSGRLARPARVGAAARVDFTRYIKTLSISMCFTALVFANRYCQGLASGLSVWDGTSGSLRRVDMVAYLGHINQSLGVL